MKEYYGDEGNGRLLLDLVRKFKANTLGNISNFFEVEPRWRCPCCMRDKGEIARLDKNNNLLCSIHNHHDHFDGRVMDNIRELQDEDALAFDACRRGLVRFQNVLICNDCNVAEPYAKNLSSAPEDFSFTPFEIATFIIVKPNEPHEVDPGRARAAFDSARESMKLLWVRLRSVRNSMTADTFEPLGESVGRVVTSLKNRRSQP